MKGAPDARYWTKNTTPYQKSRRYRFITEDQVHLKIFEVATRYDTTRDFIHPKHLTSNIDDVDERMHKVADRPGWDGWAMGESNIAMKIDRN